MQRTYVNIVILRAFLPTIKMLEVSAPKNSSAAFLWLFTDGGSKHPRCPMARIATWSVVEDISASRDQQKEVLDFVFLQELKYPLFQVSQNGIVAELFAVVIAAMKANLLDPIPCVQFVTDASYVCKIIRLTELGLVMPILHKLTNSELIFRLHCA